MGEENDPPVAAGLSKTRLAVVPLTCMNATWVPSSESMGEVVTVPPVL